MRLQGIRKKLYCVTCGNSLINRKALQFCRSMDEVRELLSCPKKKQRPRR